MKTEESVIIGYDPTLYAKEESQEILKVGMFSKRYYRIPFVKMRKIF